MAAVEQPMDILVKLEGLSRHLGRKLEYIRNRVGYLKGIKDDDNIRLDSFLLSFAGYGEYKKLIFEDYKKLIESLNIETESLDIKTEVRTLLTTLFEGSLEQPIKIKKLTELIGEDVRIVLKRCYLRNKINESNRIAQELGVITKAIESIKSIRSY